MPEHGKKYEDDAYHGGRRVSYGDHLDRINAQAAEISGDPYGLDPYDERHFGPDEDEESAAQEHESGSTEASENDYSKGYSREDGYYPSSYWDD
jgi:hypothetical protein